MPIFNDISFNLCDEWEKLGGTCKQNNPNIYLYWSEKDTENHIHIYRQQDRAGIWNYNIKCNNNEGKERKEYTISSG